MADPTLLNPLEEALDAPAVLEWLRPLGEAGSGRKNGAKRVGGKAAALGRLIRDGYPVPEGWVLDARHFTRLVESSLPRGHDLATLVKIATTKAGVDRAARARDRILGLELPEGLAAALSALWLAVEGSARWGLAVRSSATCEDSETTSLAGLATSVLGVRGPGKLADAVREVWASAFLPQALAYLARAGVRELGMAVVIQRMVPAAAAGVLFTAPPVGLESEQWRPGERLVNATFGLGAPVVEGACACDAVRLARQGGAVVAAAVADKRSALVVGPEGLVEVAIPEARARRPALGPDALRALAHFAERLEIDGAGPFDIEFAVEALPGEGGDEAPAADAPRSRRTATPPHRVWLLQVRPLTGGGYPEGGDATTVWSRTNVGEALPGAATPLTWSVARAFSDKGFREAFDALGCHVPRGVELVGNVHGRFYLNLSAFMQVAAQVPGLSPRALLSASGGAGEAVIRALEKQTEHVSKRRFYTRLPFALPRQLAQKARLEREVSAYEVDARRQRRALLDLDLGLLPDDALATTLRGASALLDRTGTLMLACASASLASHLALCRLLERMGSRKRSARGAGGDEGPLFELVDALSGPAPGEGLGEGSASLPASGPEALAQALEGGVHELESASPGLALARVADVARDDGPARERLLAGAQRLEELPAGPTRRALERFLEEYGDRAVREAELATPRWREDPAPLLAMLVSTMRAAPGDPERALARARALADRALARLETHSSGALVVLVRTLVALTQRFTRLRERMRSWVTRVLGLLRVIALDVDRRLRRLDHTLPPGSVFFCTFDELIAALRSGRAEIGHVIRLRHAEHVRDAARPDPPPTFIGRPPPATLPPAEGMRLVGLPASSGVVEGRARVLPPGATGLDTLIAGEILVSRTTDVGLSPLFLVAAAVVTELGGPLSHAAVVAREYGVPAVVNVPGATLAIRTGDRIRVDGDRGIVERLDDRPALRPSIVPPV